MSNIIEPPITIKPRKGNFPFGSYEENDKFIPFKFDYQDVLKLTSNKDFVLKNIGISVAKGDPIEVIQYKHQVVPASGKSFVYVLKSHKDKQFDTLNTGKGILIEENYIVPADIHGFKFEYRLPDDMGSTTTKQIKVRLLEDVKSLGCTPVVQKPFNIGNIFDKAESFINGNLKGKELINLTSNLGANPAGTKCVQYKKGQIVDCTWSHTSYPNARTMPYVTINDCTNTKLTPSQYVEVNENTPAYTDTPIKIRLLQDVYGNGCYEYPKEIIDGMGVVYIQAPQQSINTKLPSCFFYKKGDVLDAVSRLVSAKNFEFGARMTTVIQLNNGQNLGLDGGSHDYELQPHQYEIVTNNQQKPTNYPENLHKRNKLLNIALISVGALVALNIITRK
jgi:hypothetical protein